MAIEQTGDVVSSAGDDAANPVPASPQPDMQPNRGLTLKEIMGKKRRGSLMPSSVQRKEERRKRRRAQAVGIQEPPSQAEPRSRLPEPEPEDPGQAAEVVAPQMTLDENGNIVVDQASLVVTAGGVTNAEAEQGDVTMFENHEYTNHITSATFAKRETAVKWEAEETNLFYAALRKYGSDFSLMEQGFPNRTRKQLKLKFKREERENPKLIDAALSGKVVVVSLPEDVPGAPRGDELVYERGRGRVRGRGRGRGRGHAEKPLGRASGSIVLEDPDQGDDRVSAPQRATTANISASAAASESARAPADEAATGGRSGGMGLSAVPNGSNAAGANAAASANPSDTGAPETPSAAQQDAAPTDGTVAQEGSRQAREADGEKGGVADGEGDEAPHPSTLEATAQAESQVLGRISDDEDAEDNHVADYSGGEESDDSW